MGVSDTLRFAIIVAPPCGTFATEPRIPNGIAEISIFLTCYYRFNLFILVNIVDTRVSEVVYTCLKFTLIFSKSRGMLKDTRTCPKISHLGHQWLWHEKGAWIECNHYFISVSFDVIFVSSFLNGFCSLWIKAKVNGDFS